MRPFTAIIFLLIPALLFANSKDESYKSERFVSLEPLVNMNDLPDKVQLLKKVGEEDLIVGYENPDETVEITEDMILVGNIMVFNNGTLIIKAENFTMKGDIYVLDNGIIDVESENFTILQNFIYEHNAIVMGSGLLQFNNTHFKSGGQSWSAAVLENSSFKLSGCEISDGFITTTLMGKGSATLTDTKTPGEYLCFDESRLSFSGCDFLIYWLVADKGSKVELSFPDGESVDSWQFPGSLPDVEGVNYSVEIENCTDVNWALISRNGSDVTFSDSRLRVAGIQIVSDDSVYVSGLTNNTFYKDRSININDRDLRFVNTNIQTWNFYASAGSKLNIENSVFGEILTQDSSRAVIKNSLCDGSGGYAGAFGNSFMHFTHSFIRSELISRDRATLFTTWSSVTGLETDSDESSVMVLAHTSTFVEPEAHDTSVTFELYVPFVKGYVGDEIPIHGSGRVLAGEYNPIEFINYKLEYAPKDTPDDWRLINESDVQVHNGQLALWNTGGLEAGVYNFRLSLYHSFGDSVVIQSYGRLFEDHRTTGMIELKPLENPDIITYSNEDKGNAAFEFFLDDPGPVRIEIFDLEGRKIGIALDDYLQPGKHRTVFSGDMPGNGIYVYKATLGGKTESGKFIIIK